MLELKEFACDLAERTELSFEDRAMNAVLGLKESVCDTAKQSLALKAEL